MITGDNSFNNSSRRCENESTQRIELFIEPEYIIVNLVEADKKKYLSVSRLFRFVAFLKDQLSMRFDELQEANEFIFNISFDSIERTVRYHDKVFDLIGDTIYIKNDNLPEVPQTQKELLSEVAKEFVEVYAA